MLSVDLRGDARKQQFVKQYEVKPLLAAKMTDVRSVAGACGPVAEEFHIFSAHRKHNGNGETVYAIMGPGCAKGLYNALDVSPIRPFQPSAAFTKGNDIPEVYHRLCPYNRQLHDAIWLLCLAWKTVPMNHLLEALHDIYSKLDVPVDASWTKRFQATVNKDKQGRNLTQIMADLRKQWPNLRWFDFSELEI